MKLLLKTGKFFLALCSPMTCFLALMLFVIFWPYEALSMHYISFLVMEPGSVFETKDASQAATSVRDS